MKLRYYVVMIILLSFNQLYSKDPYPKNPNISNLHNPILINKKKINILGVVPKISKSNQKNKNFRLKSFFHPLLGGQFSQREFIKKCQDKFNILLKKYAN